MKRQRKFFCSPEAAYSSLSDTAKDQQEPGQKGTSGRRALCL